MKTKNFANDKAKDFKGTLKQLFKYLGKSKIALIIVIGFAIFSTLFAILGPKILGMATTELFEELMAKISGAKEFVSFAKILKILIFLISIYLVSMIFSYIQGFITSSISNKLMRNLRKDINEKIHNLPFSYYDNTTNGDILSRITNDVDTISQSFNQSITQIITAFTTLVGITIMMFSISFPMTLIAILTLPVSIVLIGLVVKHSQKYFMRQQNYLGDLNGFVEENYSCHTVVKAFNGEHKSLNSFTEINNDLYDSTWKANFLSGLMFPIMNIISNIGYVIVCIIGGYFAAKGNIKVGDIQAFIQYMRQFSQPVAQLSQISNVLQQTIAAAERVFEFLNAKEEIKDKPHALGICANNQEANATKIKVNGNVEFNDVHFGYKADEMIIKGFSASVKPGQKIAIVGPTGAGKSTIIKLLMRFYDVDSGAIMLEGHNIKDFKRDELRSVFGMVLQETWLYNDTIANNIKYGKLDATMDEIHEAAIAAQVDHFVKTLPDGYNMILSEEASNVSQGQKQLLTIARAILADPKILILDEATSSVDTRTEILIQKAMDNLMKGRTSFIIAHRLSTIKNADLILVMKDGDIIEQGSHDELLNKNGFYANLYNSQFVK